MSVNDTGFSKALVRNKTLLLGNFIFFFLALSKDRKLQALMIWAVPLAP